MDGIGEVSQVADDGQGLYVHFSPCFLIEVSANKTWREKYIR